VGFVERHDPGAQIEVGEATRVEGRLVTRTGRSRIRIGSNVFVGRRTVIEAFASIEIGDESLVSYECIIADSSPHSLRYEERRRDIARWQEGARWEMPGAEVAPIRIGRGVWVGARVIILAGVSIGDECVVGAGSVVTKDVPAGTLVAGNPARVVRRLEGSSGDPASAWK
jgi:acetyltransferase-like isoleucine patch superfamily enzyme